ncbi:MAG: hypothetical protein ACJATT_004013 [Myxococcota bacterium]|jgi:uncharacterized protein (TIGR00730 family)
MPLQPEKAYKNQEFLSSPAARHIRILCEYEETRQRLHEHGVKNTIVMFGSARINSPEDSAARVAELKAMTDDRPEDYAAQLKKAERAVELGHYYEGTRELARRLTEWSIEREGKRSYYITSGGGPGIMEAANRGAADVPGGKSVGLGISLPFEAGVNDWVTPELAFEFHYFFTRKLWFLYLCKALIVCPGGFGTMDELFESLTLMQTKKIKKPMPVVLYGTEYWDKVFNVEAMADFGTISHDDINLFFRTDSIDDAFDYVTKAIEEQELQIPDGHTGL